MEKDKEGRIIKGDVNAAAHIQAPKEAPRPIEMKKAVIVIKTTRYVVVIPCACMTYFLTLVGDDDSVVAGMRWRETITMRMEKSCGVYWQ